MVGDDSAPSIVTTEYTDRMGNVARTGKVSDGTEYLNCVGDLLTERTAAAAQKNMAYTALYRYNGLGQAVKVYNALDQYTTSIYNALGQLVQTRDYAGIPTAYGAEWSLKMQTIWQGEKLITILLFGGANRKLQILCHKEPC